ncbi:MAG: DNA replication/repair protein RecF [Peptococcaceae bacterium]|nr:DNA replication/repair protein RecF [Peptococcaceae bacterium]
MEIKNLSLLNFRNYEKQRVSFESGLNLLYGSNGQGKTNVLEAVYFLLTGKSYRVRQEKELILWDQKSFYLHATCSVLDRIISLESYYEPGKKVMKVNQIACKRLSDYVGIVNAVFFSPDDLSIIKKGPNERRRFLDLLISQIKPSHISLLNSYLRIIKQKNNLLKNEKNIFLLKSQLEIWNQQLIDIGSKIIINRAEFTERLNNHSQKIFKDIFSPNYNLSLNYFSLGKKDVSQALKVFPEILENKLLTEIERRTVIIGPHRDDLLIDLNGKPAKMFASQGQQRTMVLCLKLSEMEIIFNEKGDYPILLLDDVLSELDEYRRKFLINYIDNSARQTLITMTDLEKSLFKKGKAIYQIINGTIRRENNVSSFGK